MWLQEGRKVKVPRCLLPNPKMNECKIIWRENKQINKQTKRNQHELSFMEPQSNFPSASCQNSWVYKNKRRLCIVPTNGTQPKN